MFTDKVREVMRVILNSFEGFCNPIGFTVTTFTALVVLAGSHFFPLLSFLLLHFARASTRNTFKVQSNGYNVKKATELFYVEIKCQLDATEVFIADLIACSTCFGHHHAHRQELKSIIQWLLPVVFRAVVFKLLV